MTYPNYRRYVPQAVIIALTVVVVGGLIAVGVIFVNQTATANAATAAMQAEWDAGKGRPQAARLDRNPNADVAIDVPQTIGSVDNRWSSCSSKKSCKGREIKHFPMVYSIGSVSMSNNCFTGKPSNPVDHLMVASTKGGGTYKFSYSADGKGLTVCATSSRQKGDKLVVWSDHPAAER